MTLLLIPARLETKSPDRIGKRRLSSSVLPTALIAILSTTLVLKLAIDKGLAAHTESQRAQALISARQSQLEADVEDYGRNGFNTPEDKQQAEAVEANVRLKERLAHPDLGPAWCAPRGH
jgi:hypothetical protein